MNSGESSSKPDLYVIARIIKVLKEKNRMNRTTLATSTGMAYDKLVRYLAWMSEKGFIKFDDNGLVVLTKEGSEAYDELVQWIMKLRRTTQIPPAAPADLTASFIFLPVFLVLPHNESAF